MPDMRHRSGTPNNDPKESAQGSKVDVFGQKPLFLGHLEKFGF